MDSWRKGVQPSLILKYALAPGRVSGSTQNYTVLAPVQFAKSLLEQVNATCARITLAL